MRIFHAESNDQVIAPINHATEWNPKFYELYIKIPYRYAFPEYVRYSLISHRVEWRFPMQANLSRDISISISRLVLSF